MRPACQPCRVRLRSGTGDARLGLVDRELVVDDALALEEPLGHPDRRVHPGHGQRPRCRRSPASPRRAAPAGATTSPGSVKSGRGPAAAERAEHLGHAAVLTPPLRVHELGLERPAGPGDVELGAGHGDVTRARPGRSSRSPAVLWVAMVIRQASTKKTAGDAHRSAGRRRASRRRARCTPAGRCTSRCWCRTATPAASAGRRWPAPARAGSRR